MNHFQQWQAMTASEAPAALVQSSAEVLLFEGGHSDPVFEDSVSVEKDPLHSSNRG